MWGVAHTYDAEGNLTQVDSGATAKYTYDALNQRVRIDEGGTSHEFVFNVNGQRISTWDAASHGWFQGQVYWDGIPIEFNQNSAAHFQHQDYQGTERSQTSYNGGVEGTYTSLPFGDGYSVSGSDLDSYHFAMLDHDSSSDTHHAQFRQYESTQGRWMSPDPYSGSYDFSNPQSLNRYSYVERELAYLKNHPVTGSFNEIGAIQFTYQQSTKSLCLNMGLGASYLPSKAVTIGVLNRGDMDHWKDVVSGWGYSFGANLILGYQGMLNKAGKVGGPTISGVGLSGSYTHGSCTTPP